MKSQLLHIMATVMLSLVLLFLARIQQPWAKETIHLEKNGKTSDYVKFDQDFDDPYYHLSHTYWSNGDIRLFPSYSDEGDSRPSSGRLEVFIDTLLNQEGADRRGQAMKSKGMVGSDGDDPVGVWGTVCGMGFTMREANVACRQLGFAAAETFELSSATTYKQGNESVPIFLEGVKCPNKKLNHLMRCRARSQPYLNCTHDYDVSIYCNPANLWEDPYRGQVRLVNTNSTQSMSSGRVEIFKAGTWGTVCNHAQQFSMAAADTVCRQLGYTNALAITDAMPGSGVVWVDSITCDSSAPCFKACFNTHHWSHTCNHTYDVAVQCTYDISNSIENTAGSASKCRMRVFPVSMLVLVIFLVLGLLTAIGCAGIFIFIFAHRFCCYKKYSPIYYDQLQ